MTKIHVWTKFSEVKVALQTTLVVPRYYSERVRFVDDKIAKKTLFIDAISAGYQAYLYLLLIKSGQFVNDII